MAPSPHHRHGALLSRLLISSVVWLTTLSLLLVLAPRGTAADGDGGGYPRPTGVERRAGWEWPLAPLPRVVRPFDAPETRYAAGHRGIDLAGARGAAVLAVAAGTVTHSGTVAGRGTVTVRHRGGLASTYEPVEERVATGTTVAAGETLGTLGSSAHCPADTCLHLGARLGEEYLDPLLLLTRARIVLLPLLELPLLEPAG